MTDHDLERLLSSKGRPRKHRTWRCPGEATLAAFVDGVLPEGERSQVRGHLADCAPCLQHVAAAVRDLETPPPEVPARLLARARGLAERSTAGTLAPAWRWGMVAAAASLVLVAVMQVWQSKTAHAPATSPTEVRGAPAHLVGPRIFSPQEGSVVARDQIDFRWQEMTGAIHYEIQLVTADGDVLWQHRTGQSEARLPGTVPIAPGQEVYVWVRARLLDGKTLKSEPVRFRLADTP